MSRISVPLATWPLANIDLSWSIPPIETASACDVSNEDWGSAHFGVRDRAALYARLEPCRDRPTPSVAQMRPVGRTCWHDTDSDVGRAVEHGSQDALRFRCEQTFACQRSVLRQRDGSLQC